MSVESLVFRPKTEKTCGRQEEEQESHLLQGLHRSYALDTASLLGGDEMLVSQLLSNLRRRPFDSEELGVLRWLFDLHFGKLINSEHNVFDKMLEANRNEIRQDHLLNFFQHLNQLSLHRIVASGLLYAGRFVDTRVYCHSSRPGWRALVLDTRHLSQLAIKPLAKMDLSAYDVDGCVACHHLAIVYFRHDEINEMPKEMEEETNNEMIRPSSQPRRSARRISASIAHERSLLANIEVVAILALP